MPRKKNRNKPDVKSPGLEMNLAVNSVRNYHEDRGLAGVDVAYPFFYTRHSIVLFVTVACMIGYFAFQEKESLEENLNAAVKGFVVVFLALGMMVFPSGPFLRPHPIFWRAIFTISALYMFGLLILVFLSADQMREALKYVDSSLGEELPDIPYAENCELTFDNVWSKVDIFVLAHFLGWIGKAIILRDRVLLWVISFSWEFVENSTSYFVPNFAECWWDSWIMDFLLCNGLGIECGLWFLKTYESDYPRYEWLPFNKIPTFGERVTRTFQQFFTPHHWRPVKWDNAVPALCSPRKELEDPRVPLTFLEKYGSIIIRYAYFTFLTLIVNILDLNVFLLKLWLWVPTKHVLVMGRTFLMGFVTVVAARQLFFFVTDPKCDFIGSQLWVAAFITVLELMIIVKTRPEIPAAPYNSKVKWVGLSLGYVIFSIVALTKWTLREQAKLDKQKLQ